MSRLTPGNKKALRGLLPIEAALILTMCVGIAVAAPNPIDLLRRSIAARGTVDYAGIRTIVLFEQGEKVQGVEQRVQCDAPDRMRITILAPPAQAGSVCIHNGSVRWDYHPQESRAIRTPTASQQQIVAERLEELVQLGKNVRGQHIGTEKIAGRDAHIVKVYTRDGVPLKKSWIDTENYFVLKTQRFDSSGRVRSSSYFTKIDFNPQFAAGLFDFSPPSDCTTVEGSRPSQRMPLNRAEQQAGFHAAIPSYMPPGFAFQRNRVAVIDVEGQRALWLPFSNGADTFSLFQRRGDGPSEPAMHGRSLIWHAGPYRFTLLGPLSEAEMRRIAGSVRP